MIKDSVLIDFVLDNHHPIRAKLLFQALEGILTYNVLDIVPKIEEIILDDNYDTMLRIEAVKTEIVNTLKDVMNFIGVVPFAMVNDFIIISKVIIALDVCATEYDPDYIFENTNILVEEDSDLDKIWSIVSLLTDVNELDFYENIHSLKDGVVAGLLEVLQLKHIPEIVCDDQRVVVRYKDFVKGKAKGVVREYISSGGPIGTLEPEAMLLLWEETINGLPLPDRPFEMVSALMITDCKDEVLKPLIVKWIPMFAESDLEISMLEKAIDKLLT